MKTKVSLTIIGFVAIFAAGALYQRYADDRAPATFSQAQTGEVVSVIRSAMKANPTILRDALVSLRAADEQESKIGAEVLLAQHRQELDSALGDPVAGNPAGDVTVVEFYDPLCPYCKQMRPTIEGIIEHDRGVRLVYKDMAALGPASVISVRAILAAKNQGAYLKMQAEIMSGAAMPSEHLVDQIAASLGLDLRLFDSDMQATATLARIKTNLALASALRLVGTPSFIVGENIFRGAVSQAQLEAAIAESRRLAAVRPEVARQNRSVPSAEHTGARGLDPT